MFLVSVQTMKKIPCPKCSGHLEPTTYAAIEVDRCTHCAGIWFDSLEAEALKTIQGSESLDVGNTEIARQSDAIDRKILCPRCRIPTIRMLDLDQYSIWYECCPKCQGIWLDAGEFKQFKQNFQPRFLQRAKTALHLPHKNR
jgi:uncharacterized protein